MSQEFLRGCPGSHGVNACKVLTDHTALKEERMETAAPKIVGPFDGKSGFLGTIGVRFMIDGNEAGDRFSLVEHPMSPRALAAPLHRHTREDEYSFVLE